MERYSAMRLGKDLLLAEGVGDDVTGGGGGVRDYTGAEHPVRASHIVGGGADLRKTRRQKKNANEAQT